MKYVLKTIDQCITRLEKVLAHQKEGKFGKRDQNNMEYCIRILKSTRMLVERDLKPTKPKTIQDGIEWIRTKKKDGTFIALLTEDAQLLKTIYITDQILTEPPKYEITSEPIEVKMTKTELIIPSLDFVKPIPKKAHGIVAIAKDGLKVKVLK